MNEKNTTNNHGLIYWNTLYRAEPEDQLKHIHELENTQFQGADAPTLLCLSEATKGEGLGLVDLLSQEGYDVAFTPTSRVKKYSEGLCFASKDGLVDTSFFELRTARAIANTKTRWLGRTSIAGVKVFLTHTSYPRPAAEEIDMIYEVLSQESGPKIVGGDFNTLIGRRALIGIMAELDLVKVRDDRGLKATVQCVPGTEIGFELDHLFVDDSMSSKTTLEVGNKGPSNHRPLIATIDI